MSPEHLWPAPPVQAWGVIAQTLSRILHARELNGPVEALVKYPTCVVLLCCGLFVACGDDDAAKTADAAATRGSGDEDSGTKHPAGHQSDDADAGPGSMVGAAGAAPGGGAAGKESNV